MNYNFTELMVMLDWNNSQENQQKGIKNGKTIKDLSVFLQPLTPLFNKNVWENCAKILSEKSSKELEPYFLKLLEWLQDLNWPGAEIILKKLKCTYSKVLASQLEICVNNAVEDHNEKWLNNMSQLIQNKLLVKQLSLKAFTILSEYYRCSCND